MPPKRQASFGVAGAIKKMKTAAQRKQNSNVRPSGPSNPPNNPTVMSPDVMEELTNRVTERVASRMERRMEEIFDKIASRSNGNSGIQEAEVQHHVENLNRNIQVDRTQDVGSSLMTGRRSGECPSHLTSSCVEQCSSDSDCSHYQTCCHSGCGHTCEISRTQQGFWTNWNQWSRCSVTCGRGYRSRYRRCHSGHCSGERSETRRCNNQECQTQVQYNGRRFGVCPSQNKLTSRCMEQCSYDSECSVNQKCCFNGCGKTCEMSTTYQRSWTNWNQWSSCSVTCGRGTRSRRRQCHSGHCSGERSETRQCNNQECQNEVHYNGSGMWGEWSQWSRCSSKSGYGTRVRRRQCAGRCHGDRREFEDCFTTYLPHSCRDTYSLCSQYVRIHGCHTTNYVINEHCRKTCGLC